MQNNQNISSDGEKVRKRGKQFGLLKEEIIPILFSYVETATWISDTEKQWHLLIAIVKVPLTQGNIRIDVTVSAINCYTMQAKGIFSDNSSWLYIRSHEFQANSIEDAKEQVQLDIVTDIYNLFQDGILEIPC